MLVWTVPEDSASHGVWLIGGGGVKTLLFCLGTAYSMSSMEDIENSWSLHWQWRHATQNYYLCFKSLSSGTCANQCFPLRRACLFMFLLSHPPLVKAPIREHHCHFYALLLTVLSMTVTGSSLPWITMFSQPLVFQGALHLRFAVSERASEIPSVRSFSWLFWLKFWRLRLIIICSLVDYAIDMSLPWDLDVIFFQGKL